MALFINFFPNLIKFIYISLHCFGDEIHSSIFVTFHSYYAVFYKYVKMVPDRLIVHIHRLSQLIGIIRPVDKQFQ